MHRPKFSEVEYHPRPDDHDIQEYCEQVFMMYDGTRSIIKLKCDNSLMKTIVDRFGEDVETHLLDDKSFMVTAEIAVGPPFFSWVFNYCRKIQIIEPQSVKEEYLKRVKEAYNNI